MSDWTTLEEWKAATSRPPPNHQDWQDAINQLHKEQAKQDHGHD